MMQPKIVLRYFDARGRGQFIRHYFDCRGIAFEDERVPLSEDFAVWRGMRENRSLTGPFQKLPVLEWDGQLIAETLVIRSFLHDKTGDAALLSAEENLRHAMLCSSAYDNIMVPVGILIWSDLAFRGMDLGALCGRTLDSLHNHFLAIDRTLAEWQWLERLADRPVMLADCILWEEIDIACRALGPHLRLDETRLLARFHAECPGRESFEASLARNVCQITGRPGEAEALERIQAALRSA